MKSYVAQIVIGVLLVISTAFLSQTAFIVADIKNDVKELRNDFHDHESNFNIHVTH